MAHRDRVVVVTGAAGGLGRAIAREFAAPGVSVGLLARGEQGLEGGRREVEERGGRGLVLPCDVADAGAVEQAAERVERELGPIDVWVNNAMATVFAPVLQIRPEEYRRVIEVTYLGYVHGTLSALRRMVPRDRGVIVQVGSALAFRSIPLQSAYCAAKHAVVGFTQSLRSELLHEGSRVAVTAVHMPGMNTPQFRWALSRMGRKAQPVPPIFQPEVGARAVVWSADHPQRRALAVTLSALKVILASRLLPAAWLDRLAASKGWEPQMIDEPEDPARPHNLWEPLPGDPGAHGVYGRRAKRRSPETWVARHRGLFAVAGLSLASAAAGAAYARS